ncbi:MAG TPA: hypothetical protein PK347_10135 [Burkholderiaceae bacterium]|nr:hypothetical protein [Burkholderiaceae bacterium]
MAQRKPIRRSTHRDLSSRQWAWEFLRFNVEYRRAYAEWEHLPDAVRNLSVSDGIPLHACPPGTPMSYFDVVPAALDNETVGEWLSRTSDERKKGWRLGPSSRLKPPKEFLISEWVDPLLSPLPKEKEHIWDQFDMESVGGLVNEKHMPKFASVFLRPLTDVHELALIVDVRSPLAILERQFKDAVIAYRSNLNNRKMGDAPHFYKAKKYINNAGIYEEYVRILQRLADGENENDIRYTESKDSPRLEYGTPYPEKVKKQIPVAIQLRNEGYKEIAYTDELMVG